MTKLISLRTMAAIASATAFILAIGHVFGVDTLILSALLVVVAVFTSSQLSARLVVSTRTNTDELMQALIEKVDMLDANGVRHQIIINSISDISNDELRKLIDVQKRLNQ